MVCIDKQNSSIAKKKIVFFWLKIIIYLHIQVFPVCQIFRKTVSTTSLTVKFGIKWTKKLITELLTLQVPNFY